ncbi:hypothetical protein CLV62_11663 [Dysgonomonas alginatilytica]|uniref:Uncharacterized protein n=1 Tax=Dysgonomonas alginatilytica TaxID=1605892 RepID=A0A2V3PP19_9BACT|nr:hypothetical protein [Dysgonomonas alginatilytica]PXV63022.1 hypothetical protein CLV62_11663 [Dysgonomonas alginatilytica]
MKKVFLSTLMLATTFCLSAQKGKNSLQLNGGYGSKIESIGGGVQFNLANKPQYVIGTNAKLPIFNDIANMLQTLSDCGLGKMEEWMNKGGGYYHSSSQFYNFKSAENGILDNSIQYLLTGEETYINQVDIMLNIGLEQNSQEALKIFKDFVLKTLNATNIPIPTKLIQNIELFKKYTKDFDNYIIRFECTKAQKMEWCTLSIITKLNDNSSPYLY